MNTRLILLITTLVSTGLANSANFNIATNNLKAENYTRTTQCLTNTNSAKCSKTYRRKKPQYKPRSPKFVPPNNKVLVIIGQNLTAVGGFADNTSDGGYYKNIVRSNPQLMPGAITIYATLNNKNSFNFEDTNNEIEQLINSNIYRNTALHLSVSIKDSNREIVQGLFDRGIKQLANKIKRLKRPVYLRIGYEVDNPGHGNPDPEIFKKAWRRIVRKLNNQKVENFATVFSTTLQINLPLVSPNFKRYYPGDKFVDWMAFSYWGGPELNARNGLIDFARKHNKPVMIAESAPMFSRLNNNSLVFLNNLLWHTFYQPYFNFIKRNSDVIKAFHYISADWGLQNHIWLSNPIYFGFIDMNTQVHTNSYIKSRWIKELNNPIYMHSSSYLFKNLKY